MSSSAAATLLRRRMRRDQCDQAHDFSPGQRKKRPFVGALIRAQRGKAVFALQRRGSGQQVRRLNDGRPLAVRRKSASQLIKSSVRSGRMRSAGGGEINCPSRGWQVKRDRRRNYAWPRADLGSGHRPPLQRRPPRAPLSPLFNSSAHCRGARRTALLPLLAREDLLSPRHLR